MGKTDKARQQAYRQRMQEQGYKQYAFWLSDKAQEVLKLLAPPDGNLSSVVDAAIQHYRAYKLSKSVARNVSSNPESVTSNTKGVTSNVTNNVTSNRYMSQDLEDRILELRQSGMKLNEVAQQLFKEGYRNAKGELYNTSTISKAEARAKARHTNM